jgi:hypothetical protein
MRMKQRLYLSVAAGALFALAVALPAQVRAQTAVAIDDDDIGGVVTGPNGPEAGVWVIAETNDLPTRFAKMVVTDDQGPQRTARIQHGHHPDPRSQDQCRPTRWGASSAKGTGGITRHCALGIPVASGANFFWLLFETVVGSVAGYLASGDIGCGTFSSCVAAAIHSNCRRLA